MNTIAVPYEPYQADSSCLSTSLDSGQILYRPFSPDGDDERQMRDLVFNNAFMGRPFDVICPCKDWFSDVVLGPYIKYQPENVHVAVDKVSGRLVGYLTGSMGGERFEKQQYDLVRKKVVSLAVSLSMPWSFLELTSRQFAAHVIFRGEKERPTHPQAGAHWHFQVDKEFRGQGVGTKLLQRFASDALNADFDLIWAEVTSYPEKPPEYFEKRGWSIFDAKPTGIFGDQVDFPVETLCITKPLSALASPTRIDGRE